MNEEAPGKFYFEVHVTIKNDEASDGFFPPLFEAIATRAGWWYAIFKDHKMGAAFRHETVATKRSMNWDTAREETAQFVNALQQAGIVVSRYKIERALTDSMVEDTLHLLEV